MHPEQNEITPTVEVAQDLVAELRDHANQWELSAIWVESLPPPAELKAGPVAE